jgi:hypothetical protein
MSAARAADPWIVISLHGPRFDREMHPGVSIMSSRAIRTTGRLALLWCTTLGSVAAGCSSGPPQALLGPDPNPGQKYRTESNTTMKNGKITVKDGDVSQSGRVDLTFDLIEEEEILAVEDKRITKSRVHVVRDKATETIEADGQSNSRDDLSPLEGETIECEKNGNDWKFTLVGKTPDAKQTQKLKGYPPPRSDVDFYPGEPVKPGHRWNVDIKLIQGLMGSQAQIDSGTRARKFEKTIQWDGEPCVQIAETMDLRGRMQDEDGQWVQLEMKLAGPMQRSLLQGFTVASQMTGTMTMSGTVTEGGKKLQLTVSGPVTSESRTYRK